MFNFVTIVTGVPRSGTSMTMRMLEFGGIPTVTNHPQVPNSFNKYGCYEFGGINPDLREYEGKAVKVLQAPILLGTPEAKYKVIMPIRPLEQVVLSRKDAFKNKFDFDREFLRVYGMFSNIKLVLSQRKDMEVLEIPYDDYFFKTTEVCKRIGEFLGEFDQSSAFKAVDQSLFKVR